MVTAKFIRNDGKIFNIDNKTWKITSDGLIGFDSVENAITTQNKAIGDGSDFESERITEKDRTIKAVLMDKSNNNLKRQEARSFFVPKHSYQCHINYNGLKKWCVGRLYAFSLPTENIYKNLQIEIVLLCTTPFLFSESDFAQDIASIEDSLEFPIEFTEEPNIEFSKFKFASEVLINNNGDVETYCRAVIRANGEVVNPKLEFGKSYIRLLDTLQNNDVIEIDLTKAPFTITKNNNNIIRLIDRNSDIEGATLKVGENKISFDADSGSNLMSVVIYYNERFIGL